MQPVFIASTGDAPALSNVFFTNVEGVPNNYITRSNYEKWQQKTKLLGFDDLAICDC